MSGTGPGRRPTVIELRQYTLLPGRRDELIELFEREFVETQEEAGMAVLGQFRDLDDPDRFVWLRGFADIETRRDALSAFYGGPVWAAHGPRANATMADSDNVLLLRPAPGSRGPATASSVRPAVGAAAPDRFVAAALWHFPPGGEAGEGVEGVDDREAGDDGGVRLILDRLVPLLAQTGPAPFAVLTTEPAANTFPGLPVRTGENVVAVLTSYPDEGAHRRHLADVMAHPLVRDEILPGIERARTEAPELLRLVPTGRSLIR
ncbi:NIPSNAP family protein [Streptomyces liangshanensis]|uniref:NIPSNAP family protein n=1 Tax=Streptomyces liangshanensis TaxID=2717324 RepID=A0A6G9GZI8_9ACTN|nr:NIPSNAP family protein [Streptomyces liangshanensis]QIQ03634.1 NIPSNAP family protein [Streptomyces liangshanensis]